MQSTTSLQKDEKIGLAIRGESVHHFEKPNYENELEEER